MKPKTYKIIAYIAAAVAVLGLLSFFGGIKPVNIGAAVFPALIALWAFYKYKKQ